MPSACAFLSQNDVGKIRMRRRASPVVALAGFVAGYAAPTKATEILDSRCGSGVSRDDKPADKTKDERCRDRRGHAMLICGSRLPALLQEC